MTNRTLAAITIAFVLLVAHPPLRLDAILSAAVGNPGPYDAVIDRVARPKPTNAAPAAAGGRFIDAAFGSRMLRVTDRNTRPASANVRIGRRRARTRMPGAKAATIFTWCAPTAPSYRLRSTATR